MRRGRRHRGFAKSLRAPAQVRAKELDPSIGEEPPIRQALAVLERHGGKPGISNEILDLEVEILQSEDQ